MRKLFYLAAAMAGVLVLGSCDSSDEEYVTAYNYNQNYTYVFDTESNTGSLNDGAKYGVKVDYTNQTISFEIADIKVDPAKDDIDITLRDASFKVDKDGGIVVSVPSFVSIVGGKTHNVTSFYFHHVTRTFIAINTIIDTFEISYVIDGRYAVRAVQTPCAMVGKTVLTDLSDGTEKTDTRPIYVYRLNRNTGKATFEIQGLTYNNKIYNVLSLEDIDYTISNRGLIFSAQGDVVPKTYTTPVTDMVIKNFSATTTFVPQMSVSFQINDECKVNATVNGTGSSANAAN